MGSRMPTSIPVRRARSPPPVSGFGRSLRGFLRAGSPRRVRMGLRARPAFARRLEVYVDQARFGAERLRAAGARELAAVVAEHHAPEPTSEVTRRLQRADGRN